jgi:HJR/Mrr/RecB family endonuclease
MLDFKELSVNGDDFELLIRELLYNKGLEVYWSGKDQDGGKDLLCIERQESCFKNSSKRWLIQCKHNAHSGKSVGIGDLDNIVDSCTEHNATGYLLVCSTYPSSGVVKRLEGIQNSGTITTAFWDCKVLERELLKPEN